MNQFYNPKVIINKELSLLRLDKVLTKKIENISRSQVKLLIQNGNVKKNKETFKDASYLVKEGDLFEINIFKKKMNKFEPEKINLDIVYEDDHLIVLNKAAGIVTHPAPGNENGTLVHALLYYTKNKLSKINENSRPGIVHRLDKDTSGLMVIAKTDYIHSALAEQFKTHNIKRKYKALVWGIPNNQTIEGYMERHKINRKKMILNKNDKGKYSKTNIILKKNYGNSSLIECVLHTGRTHQVRVHLSSINSPLVGDKLYGKNKLNQFSKNKEYFNKFLILKNFERQALHAYHLSFFHPILKKDVQFNSDIPQDMRDLTNFLVKY